MTDRGSSAAANSRDSADHLHVAARHMESGTDFEGHDAAGSCRDAVGIDLRAKVREILSQHGRLAGRVDQLSDTSDLYSAGLTSLATVGLMLALEDEFEIEFPDAMLSRKTFASIDSLLAAVTTLRES